MRHFFLMLWIGLFCATVQAAIPLQVDHQGVIEVNGVRFDGTGQFKFAIVDPDTSIYRWANDGTTTTGEPTTAVTLTVTDGLYSVRLGNASLTNMASLASTTFDDDNVTLRIWFNDGATGFQQLQPDQPLASVPYAFAAERVADGSITAAQLASDPASLAKVTDGTMVSSQDSRIGIGASTPSADLHIATASNRSLQIDSTNANTNVINWITFTSPYAVGLYIDGQTSNYQAGWPINRAMLYLDTDTSASSSFDFIKAQANGSGQFVVRGNGAVYASSYNNVSSRKFKKDIKPLAADDYQDILQKIEKLDVYRFRYKSAKDDTPPKIGLITEESPMDLLSDDGQAVDLAKAVGCLLAAVKAQQEEIKTLRKQVQALSEK